MFASSTYLYQCLLFVGQLLGHSYFDVNVVVSVSNGVHPLHPFVR